MPDAIIRWTAWLSMAALAGAIALRLRGTREQTARNGGARWFWTAACALLWAHVASAFQFQHGWSKARAYAHTAAKTARFNGIGWGGGPYFNYPARFVLGRGVAAG